MRAFLLVLSGLGIGGYEGKNILLDLDHAFRLKIPALRKLGLFKCAGEIETVAPCASFGMIAHAETVFNQHKKLVGISETNNFDIFDEIPDALIRSVADIFRCDPLYCKKGDFAKAVNECGYRAETTRRPILYVKEKESELVVAAFENSYETQEFYELIKLLKQVVGQNIYLIKGLIFAGAANGYYKTSNKIELKSVAQEENGTFKLFKNKKIDIVGVGKVLDYFDSKNFNAVFASKTDGLTLRTLEKLAGMKKDMFVYANLTDFYNVHMQKCDNLGARECIEAIDGTIAVLMDKMQEDDILIITSDIKPELKEYVPILIYSKKQLQGQDLGRFDDFDIVNASLKKHFNLT